MPQKMKNGIFTLFVRDSMATLIYAKYMKFSELSIER